MNEDLQAVLAAVDGALSTQVDTLVEFLREGDDPTDVYAALTLALIILPQHAVMDLAFAGIVRAANVKLAEEDAATADADV